MTNAKVFGVTFAALSLVSAPAAAQTAAQKTCGVAVMTEYVKARLPLLQEALSEFSIDKIIAERRLQEQYCMQLARCFFDPSNQGSRMSHWAMFSSCLSDEQKEK